ncbi:PKD domain protein [Frankia torreyi]|uniref:PKD domain protein n=2 Tax=Frankia TaxID=1854 RepID=A0A0D8BD28_9ACTN|nr:tannase/feruloyl esterase family alpha/beta hydrolase [Frankia torreyi]KJE21854.1 PKD domain protein [Frankia torreyi]
MTSLGLDSYVVTDSFFGVPYIDEDEQRSEPVEHRYIHGGFEGTSTRFALCYPPAARWQGRLFQPLEGANAGHENVNTGPLGQVTGGLEMIFRMGGYAVESNMGHIGDVMDPKAGPDPTIYGYRAAAESARFAKFVAAQIYGAPTAYAYVYGGSGGARRSPLCLAYAPDVWDAALPYMGDAQDGDYGDLRLLRNGTPNFSSMFNVQRVLGDKIHDVIDAMWPGGSGDPFAGLNTHQREELANVYRIGYPRGDESFIAQPMGQMWLWSSMATRLQADYPEYWENFWTRPGHVGFDQPELVRDDLIELDTTVRRVLYAKDLLEDPTLQTAELGQVRALAALFAAMNNMWHIPMAVQLDEVPTGYILGAGVELTSGAAAGRKLYVLNGHRDVLLVDSDGEAANLRFTGVEPGDRIRVDNHAFLAYCYYYRHHLLPWEPEYDFLRVDGQPLYQQYELPEMSPFMGVKHTGRIEGKLLWVHHTHDSSLWPPQGLGFKANIEREYGVELARTKFRLRWTENAEHVPPNMAASVPGRANTTYLVDYQPIIEQSLADLIDWVENGVEPVDTEYDYRDGAIVLPATAKERRGIQPVVSVTANGGSRAEVAVGEAVTLSAHAETPPGAGTIIGLRWDFDGQGSFPRTEDLDGSQAEVTVTTTHAYDAPGTYFATALVESHRDGDVAATSRRIPNLASARIIVR